MQQRQDRTGRKPMYPCAQRQRKKFSYKRDWEGRTYPVSISASRFHLADLVASTIYESKGLEFNDASIFLIRWSSAINSEDIGVFIQFFP
jgi:hypothetical protein